MNRIKLARVIAGLLVASVSVMGCGQSTSDGSSVSILDRVQQDKVLKVGVIDGNPPWSKIGANGQPEGYDIDIAKAIADVLGVKPVFTTVDIAGRVTSLQTNQLDLVIANFTRTPQRELTIDFSPPYVIVRGAILTLASSPYKTPADLNNPSVTIATGRGGTTEKWVPAAIPNAKLVFLPGIGDLVQALNSNQADGIAHETLFAAKQMADNPGKYSEITGTFPAEYISIGMPKGDYEWSRWIDVWVSDFSASGADAALFKKWFGFDMPPLQ